MRINHHILVLVFVCTLGGLALAAGLYRLYDNLNAQMEQEKANLLAEQHATRLQESLAHWLVWSDLIFGNGNTYLVDGAVDQGSQLHSIIDELQRNTQGGTHEANLQALEDFVTRNTSRLRMLLQVEHAERDAYLYESLLAIDEASPAVIETMAAMSDRMQADAVEQRHKLANTKTWTGLVSVLLCGVYLTLVVIAWRYTSVKMVRPIRDLIQATAEAHQHEGALTLVRSGPFEIRQLNETLSRFASDLESRIQELNASNESLEEEMRERKLVEESLRQSESTLRVSEARFHSIFQHSNDAIIVVDVEGDAFVDVNPQACTLLGYPRDELLTIRPSDVHQQELPAFERFCQNVMSQSHGRTDELTCETKMGQRVPAEISASVFTTPDHRRCILALIRDITARKQAEAEREAMNHQLVQHTELLEEQRNQLEWEVKQRVTAQTQLQHDALHDALTDLPNRRLFKQRLEQSIVSAEQTPGYRFAVLFIDLDNFKVVNDSLGHDAGDELLVASSRRLVACLRELDMVGRVDEQSTARLGGDEFIILVDDIKKQADVMTLADRIQDVLTRPHEIAGYEVSVGASIGIAIYDESDSRDSEKLLRDADTAMYRAKLAGKSQHALFDQAMHEEVASRLTLENDLRRAVENRDIQLRYQPIIALETATVTSFEALVRWERQGHGFVSPAEFIPIAEDINLITTLGRWVLTEACHELVRLNELRPADQQVSMAVNVSQKQLQQEGFVQDVLSILQDTGVPASALKLEVTESMVMADPEAITEVLERLRAEGIQIAMDDFGTGYSSLSCLHKLPLNVLKIDQAFIATMSCDVEYAAIINAIITLAMHLGLEVVAEGIETAEQMAQMIALECTYGQGYLFSKPVTAEEARGLINRQFSLRMSA